MNFVRPVSLGRAFASIIGVVIGTTIGTLVALAHVFAETPPSGLVCRESLVSQVVDGVERVESTRICVDLLSRPSGRPLIRAIASENCLKSIVTSRPSSCMALKKAEEVQSVPPIETRSMVAPKDFDLCLRLGGEPSSLRFQLNGLWHVTSRCLFRDDFSFIDTESFSAIEKSVFKKLGEPSGTAF